MTIKFKDKFYIFSPKFITGDLIKFKGKYYSIMEVSEDSVSIWYSDKRIPQKLTVRINDVTPIPLTNEFLIENKWTLFIREKNGNKVYSKDRIHIEYDSLKDKFFYFDDKTIELKYISDLQHLLFGLKATDNFY